MYCKFDKYDFLMNNNNIFKIIVAIIVHPSAKANGQGVARVGNKYSYFIYHIY